MSRSSKIWRQPIKCARPDCANMFVPQNRDQKFCSPKCRNAPEGSRTVQRGPAECAGPGCSSTFVLKSSDHKYCSKTCKERAHAHRQALNGGW